MVKLAFVFPGQASQHPGMAAELLAREPAARALFARANSALDFDLAAICTTADEATLTRTEIAQPALLTTSVAWLEVLTPRGVTPALVAGHSLGEFAAWVAAGVLTFEEALTLVQRRGALMEAAGATHPGRMSAVIGLTDEQVTALCDEARAVGEVVIANYNSPGQVVVSGESAAVTKVTELAKAAKGRVLPLRVSGAFHSPLMQAAAEEFAALVAAVPIHPPRVPVIANVTAELVTTAEGARAAMTRHMISSVRWTASIQKMVEAGIHTVLEVGPGQVLTKLIERTAPVLHAHPVSAPAALAQLLAEVTT